MHDDCDMWMSCDSDVTLHVTFILAVVQVPECDGVSRGDPGGGTVSRSADHHRHQLQTPTVCLSKTQHSTIAGFIQIKLVCGVSCGSRDPVSKGYL